MIRRAAKFLNKPATEHEIAGLCEHLKFSRMAANPAVNMEHALRKSNNADDNPDLKFLRKGKIGDWKNYMSDDLAYRFDHWMEKHLRDTGLKLESSDD